MTDSRVTIELADEADDPADELLRGLAADLAAHEDLSGAVRGVPRPPVPGEQGAVTAAVEVLNAAGPYASALVGAVFGWLTERALTRRVRLRVRRADGAETRVDAPTAAEAERLLRFLGEGQG
ncbi:hypothetical protein E1265_22015 [Streptomyces sp. 8K308]|uniref:effector-associated constant component EACC1 n=1 Tax=Streptomyces sp. 8K308 TaxID=2530388 RepID=UPI0010437D32|nr:hypothetical protein [Streptomyces sp. 8K308]TDC20487.1 hypothetical protein E1265_22015 [Streptomyces sp. 8K308]